MIYMHFALFSPEELRVAPDESLTILNWSDGKPVKF